MRKRFAGKEGFLAEDGGVGRSSVLLLRTRGNGAETGLPLELEFFLAETGALPPSLSPSRDLNLSRFGVGEDVEAEGERK